MKSKHRIKAINFIYLFVTIFAFVSMVLSFVFYINSMNQMNRNEENIVKKESDSFAATFNNTLDKFTDISARINNDTECKLLKTYYYDILNDNPGKVNALNKVSELLENYTETSELAALVGLRIKPTEEYSCSNLHSSSDDFSSIAEIDDILNNLSLSSLDNGLLIKNESIYSVFADGVDEKLKIVVKLNKYSFSTIFNTIGNNNNDNSVIKFTQNGDAVYVTSNFELSDNQINSFDTLNNLEISRDGNIIKYSVQVKDGLYYVKYVDSSPFTSYGAIPLNLIILSCILIIVFLVGFTFFVTVFMNKPINEIKKGYSMISRGNFDYQITNHTSTDFQALYDGFNQMSLSLQNYIDDNYLQQIRIQDSEYKILQSQINPHFLYNCFANISALCKLGDSKKAETLTNNLSLYFKYIMKNNEMYVPLTDEFDHMMKYIEIQKIRFEGRVDYDISECKKAYEKYNVPKIIFQPIVENSFKYVYSKKAKGSILRIKIIEEKECLAIVFEDNGDILKQEDVNKLNADMRELTIETSGIINVAKRIESYSNSRSHVICDLSPDLGGLRVTFSLDYETLKNEN
jgi:sensor histidine kinase YesM